MIQQLQQQKWVFPATRAQDPIMLCAADDHYVMPLAVTLYTAVTNLKEDHFLHVILMDGGISESNWMALKETLADLPITLHVIRPDASDFADLKVSHHITQTAYFRLLAARLLPDSIDKVIYLDSDTLVRHDLTELWGYELGSDYCQAAIDISCPFIDARQADKKHRKTFPYLNALRPGVNWDELGLDGSQHYFNSGVMLINLKRWRAENVADSLLACLRDNQAHVWCWDQYALNVVFAGHWKPLPAKWNQGLHVYSVPKPEFSPIDDDQFVVMRDDPAIIHFTTALKPWNYYSRHPMREEFFRQLDQTAWKGWRPDKPPFRLRSAVEYWCGQLALKWLFCFRKFRSWFSF